MTDLMRPASRVVYYPPAEDGLQFRSLSNDDPTRGQLPDGFPLSLDSALAWTRAEILAQEEKWYLDLSQDDIANIEKALRHFRGLGLVNPSDINAETFPLPVDLANRLDSVSEQCYSGIGFCLVRGMDPDKYSKEENVLLFAGISFHVAPQRGFQDQNKSQVICHVKQRADMKGAAEARTTPVFTDGPMVFHTDAGDILSLYTVQVDSAGRGRLASSWQAYNQLARNRPDIVRELSKDWVMDTYSDYSIYPPRIFPLLSYYDERMIVHCSRYAFTGFGAFVRNPALPPITHAQIEALNSLHFLAEQNSITLENHKGDILYLNNMSCLHGREALKVEENADAGDTMSPRHRMRFFLRDPKRAWKLPASVEKVWEDIYGSNFTHGRNDEVWEIDPEALKKGRWQWNG